MGGNSFLEAETLEPTQITEFMKSVAEETIKSIVRRVSKDGFDQVRIALESPDWAPVWRYEVYPDYKHALMQPNKPKVASKLQQLIIDIAEEHSLPTVFAPTMEADDVIGTMVELIRPKLDTMEVFIWSQDRDLHQLIFHPNVKMLGKKGLITDIKAVEEYWGQPAEAIPLIKALSGDKSDNIKGIAGIGPKTAANVIRCTPHRKGCKYAIEFDKLPEAKKLQVRHEWARIIKDTGLCTISTDAQLFKGAQYGGVNG